MNHQQLEKHIQDFVNYVNYKDKRDAFVSFKNSPFLKSEEGYKDGIAANFTIALSKTKFNKADIGSGRLLKTVIAQMSSANNNVVHYNQKTHFKNIANNHIHEAETILYNIYYTNDDRASFEQARHLFGNKYDLIAYLFFVKDCNEYLPIRSSIFDGSFCILGIDDFRASGNVSWDNYNQFLGIMDSIKTMLRRQLGDNNITLLNAHSFVWMAKRFHAFAVSDESKSLKKERIGKTKARGGQNFFRSNVLDYWNNMCSVTDCNDTRFLSAAHIKPWRKCTTYDESIDFYNGLLLTPNLHEAFDLGLISFDENGRIMISSQFKQHDYESLGISPSMKLKKTDKNNLPYLAYHRTNIFMK